MAAERQPLRGRRGTKSANVEKATVSDGSFRPEAAKNIVLSLDLQFSRMRLCAIESLIQTRQHINCQKYFNVF